MTYTLDRATPEQIAGRVVGEGGNHIAVTVIPSPAGKGGLLLAVRRDGLEYATWAYGLNMAETGVLVWNGEYFPVRDHAWNAFKAASADLLERANRAGIG
jgi:hypothetical protein